MNRKNLGRLCALPHQSKLSNSAGGGAETHRGVLAGAEAELLWRKFVQARFGKKVWALLLSGCKGVERPCSVPAARFSCSMADALLCYIAVSNGRPNPDCFAPSQVEFCGAAARTIQPGTDRREGQDKGRRHGEDRLQRSVCPGLSGGHAVPSPESHPAQHDLLVELMQHSMCGLQSTVAGLRCAK